MRVKHLLNNVVENKRLLCYQLYNPREKTCTTCPKFPLNHNDYLPVNGICLLIMYCDNYLFTRIQELYHSQ